MTYLFDYQVLTPSLQEVDKKRSLCLPLRHE